MNISENNWIRIKTIIRKHQKKHPQYVEITYEHQINLLNRREIRVRRKDSA